MLRYVGLGLSLFTESGLLRNPFATMTRGSGKVRKPEDEYQSESGQFVKNIGQNFPGDFIIYPVK
jgi:hypothetical protein